MQKRFRAVSLWLLTLPVLLFIYLPVSWFITSTISTRAELLSTPIHWIPQNPTLQNYLHILLPGGSTSEVARTFKVTLFNSFIVASSVTVIALVVGSLASYALVRIKFPFQRTLLMGILGTRMIPEVSLVNPLYILASRFSLLNTPVVLIITYLSFALPFAIWMMAAFFQTIPVELEVYQFALPDETHIKSSMFCWNRAFLTNRYVVKDDDLVAGTHGRGFWIPTT